MTDHQEPGTPWLGWVDTAALLNQAQAYELAGSLRHAEAAYSSLIVAATRQKDHATLSVAFRRRALLAHQGGDSARARSALQQSYAVATMLGDRRLTAEALNTLGGLELETRNLEAAEQALLEAEALASQDPIILARVEQNLGIVSNIRGDLDLAERQRWLLPARRGHRSIRQLDHHHLRFPSPLLVVETEDPLHNTVQALNDYRVMAPWQVTDPNGNRSQAAFDALGEIVGTAVMGKAAGPVEGDSLAVFQHDLDEATILAHLAGVPLDHPHAILGTATTRLVYDLDRYARTRRVAADGPETGAPSVVYTLSRETHAAEPGGAATKVQHGFLYSDGFGREIQSKIRAEPGEAPARQANAATPDRPGELVLDGSGPKLGPADPRWVGTGRTVFGSKGSRSGSMSRSSARRTCSRTSPRW